MKILIKNTVFSFLVAIILLLTVTCIDSTDPDSTDDNTDAITYGPVNLGDKLDVKNQQVWMPNYNTGKVSQMLLKFKGNRTIDVIAVLVEHDDDDDPSYLIGSVGSGKIQKGILSFKVDAMDDSNLLESDDLLLNLFNEWFLDNNGNDNIAIDTDDVKGNIITLVSQYNDDEEPIEGVIREGFSGTDNSLTGEYIYYVYVNKNCKITAGEVVKTGLDYTYNKFELSLKTGWNTILKSETYTTAGKSSYSMKVLNPSIRWVMQRI